MNKGCFILILMILLIGSVSALGITPARTSINFEPGLSGSVTFSIINSEKKDIDIIIYPQGEFNSSISLSENSFHMAPNEESKQITYNYKLPDKLSPGLHEADIVIMQLPKKSGTSQAYVGAALAVVTQLYVYVPYPGKYLEAGFSVVNANQNEDAVFIFPVIARGEMDIASAKANIDIYNKLGEKVGSFTTSEIEVKSQERSEIVYKWKAEVPVGTYLAKAVLIYDEQVQEFEMQFNVGTPDLELQEIAVNNFQLGEIAKFEMLVDNKWSEPIKDAYAETNVYNSNGEIIADFKSATADIPALSKSVLISFWDTAGIKKGDYNSEVYIKYGEKSTKKNLQFKVSDNSIEIVGLGYVISSGKSGGSSSLVVVLVIAIVVLVLVNLLWFLVLRKRMKK